MSGDAPLEATSKSSLAASPARAVGVCSVGDEISNFVDQIDALAETLPRTLDAIDQTYRSSRTELKKFYEEHCTLAKKEGTVSTYNIAAGQTLLWKRLKQSVHRASLSRELVPRGLLVALVSQFDAFVGALIRKLFELKPEIVSSSARTLTFEELSCFASIAEAREFVIEKDVESVLRENHASQIAWLGKKIGVDFNPYFPDWCNFIEVTERRNLFVHNDGAVSRQYLDVCSRHKCSLEGVLLGSKLPITNDYYERAHRCLFEIGVKLGILVWRKVAANEMRNAEASLMTIVYELLARARYALARDLLDFGTSFNKYSSEDCRIRLVINRAQAYKWLGNEAKCKEIVDAEDWTAMSLTFKLAHTVLRDDLDGARKIVDQMGAKHEEINEHTLRDYPIFKKLREQPEFIAQFERLFGRSLNQGVQDVKVDASKPEAIH